MASSFQDDTRETEMRNLFDLKPVEGRSSTDAIMELSDGTILEFELKTTSDAARSVTTVRDFGPEHVRKWSTKHWIFAFYEKGKAAPDYYLYASPAMMKEWISEKWNYVKPDFESAALVSNLVTHGELIKIVGDKEKYSYVDARSLHKRQYSKKHYLELMDLDEGYSIERMLEIYKDRVDYLIRRGSTLNNPHVPGSYFKDWSTKIVSDHAKTLIKLVDIAVKT